MAFAAKLILIPVGVVVALGNIYLYDRFFGLPGTSTIPGSWWELALMFVIPAIVAGVWLTHRAIDWHEDRRYG